MKRHFKKNTILIILFSISLSSCNTTIKINNSQKIEKRIDIPNIIGVYKNTNNHSPLSSKITIKPSNRVNYKLRVHMLGEIEINGLWTLKKDTLAFTFDLPKKKIIKELKINYGKIEKDSITIRVIDDEKQLFLGAKVIIDSLKFDINDNTIIRIQSGYIDSVRVEMFWKGSKTITINKIVNNDIEIIYEFDKIRPLVYDLIINKWIIKYNLLIPLKDKTLNIEDQLIKIE